MKAYETLYELLSSPLANFCFSFVKSREASEEIVSDVFIKLWQIRSKLTEISNLKVYLYTIARNFCLNYITRHAKNPVVRIDEIDFEPVVTLGNPEEIYLSSEAIHTIQHCIRTLPPQCRIIFQLVKEDGMSYREAADILNISVLTVRNQVFIASRKVTALIPENLHSPIIRSIRKSAS